MFSWGLGCPVGRGCIASPGIDLPSSAGFSFLKSCDPRTFPDLTGFAAIALLTLPYVAAAARWAFAAAAPSSSYVSGGGGGSALADSSHQMMTPSSPSTHSRPFGGSFVVPPSLQLMGVVSRRLAYVLMGLGEAWACMGMACMGMANMGMTNMGTSRHGLGLAWA